MQQILEALPQLPVIKQADANRWVEGITRFHSKRATWHAKRLHGIGGSEMGALVSFYRGESSSGFNTIKDVVEGKLMIRLPSFETSHMRRGNALEDLARQVFLKKSFGSIDLAAMNALATANRLKGYEFMVGNPDDIVIIDGKRYVVDYKVPNTFSDAIEFDYEVQVHHYATLAKFAGVRIDGLILAKLDMPPQLSEYLTKNLASMEPHRVAELVESIVRVDLPGCRIVSLPIELKPALQAELLAAGKDCWNDFVLKGVVPTPGQYGKLELKGDVERNLARFQQQYLMAKSGISYLTDVARQAGSGMETLLQNVDFEGKALPLSIVGVKPNSLDSTLVVNEALLRGATEEELQSKERSYSVSALLEEVQRLGGQVESDHLFESSLDSGKAEAYLKEHGVDMAKLRKPGLAIRMSTRKEDKAVSQHYEERAADRFGAWLDESLISNQGEESDFTDRDPSAETLLPIEIETGHLNEALADAFKASVTSEEQQTQYPMRAAPGLR
jgi:hypothetical protein